MRIIVNRNDGLRPIDPRMIAYSTGMSLSRGALDAYVCSANSAVEFRLVRHEHDLTDESKCFHPEFSHQFFGDSESIFGYKDLRVKLYYGAARLSTYLGMTYSDKISAERSEGVEPDEVLKVIAAKLQPGFHSNFDDFVSGLKKEANFKPYGELTHNFRLRKDSEDKGRKFEIYRTDMTTSGFREYHERMQPFVLWYIDAASFIDVDDERWEYFVVYEKTVLNGHSSYCFAGYTTVYRYYAYPTKIRPRISQMLILPPFQKQGLGTEMLQTIYSWYCKNPDVVDITVEDPSDNFARLRDFVDACNCMKLRSFQGSNLLKGFNEDMRQEAQEKLKLNKKQCRRVYEILRLQAINMNNKEEYRSFRLEVKKRLNMPYQRQKSDLAKLQKTLSADELKAALQCMTTEQRIEQLDHQYKELESEYKHILERLAEYSHG